METEIGVGGFVYLPCEDEFLGKKYVAFKKEHPEVFGLSKEQMEEEYLINPDIADMDVSDVYRKSVVSNRISWRITHNPFKGTCSVCLKPKVLIAYKKDFNICRKCFWKKKGFV